MVILYLLNTTSWTVSHASSASSASCCLAQFFRFSLTSLPAWAQEWHAYGLAMAAMADD